MLIQAKCHCANIAFSLDWDGTTPEIPARACSCSFCVKHGGVWTSNPKGKLAIRIRNPAKVSKYQFGTRTATFHVCAECGSVPFVTSEIEDLLYAVVNVNMFDNVDPAWLRRGATDFEGEDMDSRLARRKRNWIADVRSSEGEAAPSA